MELGWSFNTTSGQHQEQDACTNREQDEASPSWTLMPTGITTAQPIQKIPSEPLTDPYRLLRGVDPRSRRATHHVLPLPPPWPAALTQVWSTAYTTCPSLSYSGPGRPKCPACAILTQHAVLCLRASLFSFERFRDCTSELTPRCTAQPPFLELNHQFFPYAMAELACVWACHIVCKMCDVATFSSSGEIISPRSMHK
jgi:hypothetical protein